MPPYDLFPDTVHASPVPLEALGLTPGEAEVVLWVAQGKFNGEIGIILQTTEGTIKKHLEQIFEKVAVDNRHSLMLLALQSLNRSV